MDASTLRVLFVEDDPALQRLLWRAIKRLGLAACVVENGQAAEAAAREQAFDLAFIDENLGAESGTEVAKRLKAAEFHTPRCVCISGSFSAPSPASGPFAGGDAKPVTSESMRELVQRWSEVSAT